MESPKRRKINVHYEDKVRVIFVKGNEVKKNMISEYFRGGKLTYKEDGELCLLESDQDHYFIFSDINDYYIDMDTYKASIASENESSKTSKTSKCLGETRRKLFHEMKRQIYGENSDVHSNKKAKLSDKRVMNKKQEVVSVGKVQTEKPFLKRNVYVGWKHAMFPQSSYLHMGPTIGKVKKIILNKNDDLSVDELKRILLKEYVDDKNRCYFENSQVQIGSSDEKMITEFKDKDGRKIDFWEYGRLYLRNTCNVLKIFLYTRKITHEEKNDKSSHPNASEASKLLNEHEKILSNIGNTYSLHKAIAEQNNDKREKVFTNISNKFKNLSMEVPKENASDKINVISNESRQKEIITKVKLGHDLVSVTPTSQKNTSFANCADLSSGSSIDLLASDFLKNNDKENVLKISVRWFPKEDLKFCNIIGKGSQGVVWKGMINTSYVAIKSIQKGRDDRRVYKEIKVLDSIRHQNIISVVAVSSTLSQIYIIMEYFESHSLFDIIFDKEVKEYYCLTENRKDKIGYQICDAISFLHRQLVPILHRDIKPNNVLVSKTYQVKICDFGFATCDNIEESLKSVCTVKAIGTYLFMAPEILLDKKPATTSSDVWSFACTMIELYNEDKVWSLKNHDYDSFNCAVDNLTKKTIPNTDLVPLFLKQKLIKCFNYNPELRPEMIEILRLFENELPKTKM